ncbi:hypothetical protein ACFWY5_40790 [Nonomuraea sp. NPDC059007]|uniref:hypothetical protein n=1 Tax=Nonomuraea sp. NPDC059007 TaxID=3346692 RepID=UPI0036CB1495
MRKNLLDKTLDRLLPHMTAAATYTQPQYQYIQGKEGDGCAAYGYRWRKVRYCTYTDAGKLISCTSWAYYACGW